MVGKIKAVFVCVCLFFVLCGFAPATANYIEVDTVELGSIRVYVPSSAEFSVSDGLPVNIGNSNVTGYVLNSSGERQYQITIAVYGEQWTYRQYGTGYQNADLTVRGVDPSASTVAIQGLSYQIEPYQMVIICLLLLAVCVPIVRGGSK